MNIHLLSLLALVASGDKEAQLPLVDLLQEDYRNLLWAKRIMLTDYNEKPLRRIKGVILHVLWLQGHEEYGYHPEMEEFPDVCPGCGSLPCLCDHLERWNRMPGWADEGTGYITVDGTSYVSQEMVDSVQGLDEEIPF